MGETLRTMTRVRRFLYASFTILALSGCGGEAQERQAAADAGPTSAAVRDAVRPPAARPAPPPATVAATTSACSPGSYRRLRTARATPAALPVRPVGTSRVPAGPVTARFGLRNVNGFPTVLGVLGARVRGDCSPAWYHVQLPVKPNGATGWVRAEHVQLATVRARVVVELAARRVTLFKDGRRVYSTRAAIGSRSTPTPTGTFYVNQRLVPGDPNGPFGPGAIGISAFSEVLTGWVQGGPVAIHGTNRPELIGRAVSNGCIRVSNDALRRLWRDAVAGTPVVVRA
jgi:lipoprotein-anchoring transpeptidase ErfK/SrfK